MESLSTSDAGKTGYPHAKKMKLTFTIQKFTKMDQRPNVRAKTIKLLEESIGTESHHLRFGNGFLNYDTKSTGDKKNKIKYTGLQQN